MKKSCWNLLGAGCGIVDVLLSLIALLIVPLPPVVGSSVKEVLSYYTSNGPTLVLSNYLFMLATVFFLGCCCHDGSDYLDCCSWCSCCWQVLASSSHLAFWQPEGSSRRSFSRASSCGS